MAYKSGNIITLSGGIYVIDTNDYVLGDIKATTPLSAATGPDNKPHLDLHNNIEYVKAFAESFYDTLSGHTMSLSGHGLSGNIVGTSDTQVLSNKTFDDSTTSFQDNLDNTKKFKFQASSISPSTTRTIIIPDDDATLVGDDTTQILTNKTLSGGTKIQDIVNISANVTSSNLNTLTAGTGSNATALHKHDTGLSKFGNKIADSTQLVGLNDSQAILIDASAPATSDLDSSSHFYIYSVWDINNAVMVTQGSYVTPSETVSPSVHSFLYRSSGATYLHIINGTGSNVTVGYRVYKIAQ